MEQNKLYANKLYKEDVRRVAGLPLLWEKLQGRALMLSGASGMIGSFLVDVIMQKNESGLSCHVYALGRDPERLEKRFSGWEGSSFLHFIPYDVKCPIKAVPTDQEASDRGSPKPDEMPETDERLFPSHMDYILHLASNTHPVQYATDPIGTITTNLTGLQNMLDYAEHAKAVRVLFASSNEIYGENRGDVELFTEDYCGYIDPNSLRAGYPESKRCGEALCQAYRKAKGMDIVIPRLTRSYGPTMLMTDTKAISQFIKKGVAGEDIILKSEGTQLYSYTYVADAVSGLLTILLSGKDGEAYNIADEASDIMLKDLADIIASEAGKKVVFELPDATESAGYSKATKARLDGSKCKALGWKPHYEIREGLERTIRILRQL